MNIESIPFPELLTSLLAGAAAGLMGWAILKPLNTLAPISSLANSDEDERRNKISKENVVFRLLQPLVYEFSRINKSLYSHGSLRKLEHSLSIGGSGIPWKAEEYLAVKQIQVLFAAPLVGLISLAAVGPVAAVLIAVFVAIIYTSMAAANAHELAERRLRSLKMRLPYAVDLMALMIEAGATFRDALITVVQENKGHPLGIEFGAVDRQIQLGRPRAAALRSFQELFQDQDIMELIFAINKGEELGTPLAKILRNQADQMRLKRSQWGEKAAAEAEVKLSFPGLIVMMACMLIVLAPIVLPALSILQSN